MSTELKNPSLLNHDPIDLSKGKDGLNDSTYYEEITQSQIFDSATPEIQLVWEDIRYQVTIKKKPQEILKGISGSANPGEFLAIMGLSGAGKTSLLNIVAGRIKTSSSSKVSGTIKANGIDINQINFQKYCAYVTQEDILLPFLTVREALTFSAGLRCAGTAKEIKDKVDGILHELRLTGIADNMIGDVMFKGISGGEKKRTSIGVELISEPQIIILDEPTSGLDSFTAELLVDLLIQQAKKGRTVIATIHQPSTSIFKKFNKLILLSEGFTMYQGSAVKSRKYFSQIGYKTPRLVNPAEYYIKLLHITNRYDMTKEESEILENLKNAYDNHENKKDKVKDLGTHQLNLYMASDVSSIKKIWILTKRSFLNNFRNPGPSQITIGFYIITSILIDLLFYDLGNDYEAIHTINGVMYFLGIMCVQIGNTSSAMTFPLERTTFFKEHGQGLYGVITYYITKMIAELPLQILAALVVSPLLYFPLGLDFTAQKFVTFIFIVFLSQWMGHGLGYIVGSLCSTILIANAVVNMVSSPLIAYEGLMDNTEAFKWVQNISPFKWSFQTFCINQYTDMHWDCDPRGPKCDPLSDLGFNDSIGMSILYCIVFSIAVRIIAFIELKVLGTKLKNL